jgi:hypothetical protein
MMEWDHVGGLFSIHVRLCSDSGDVCRFEGQQELRLNLSRQKSPEPWVEW